MQEPVQTTPTSSKPRCTGRARRFWLVGGGMALAAILLTLWVQWGQDVLIVRKWGVVQQGLVFRSGQISSWRIEGILKDNHIARVVSLSGEDEDADATFERKTCERLAVDRKVFMMSGDGVASAEMYADAVAAIVESRKIGNPVLVHCHSGSQRTGAVVTLYRLLVLGDTPAKAREELLRYGHDPDRNPKLIRYVNQQMPEVARRLAAKGVIAGVPNPLPRLDQ